VFFSFQEELLQAKRNAPRHKNQIKNNIGQPNQCDETLIASVSFTPKLAFYIHNFGGKKIAEKIPGLNFFKRLFAVLFFK